MSRRHSGFRIKQHKPWKLWAGLCLISLLFWGFFVAGQTWQSLQSVLVDLDETALLTRIDELESRNYALVQKNAKLGGNSEIERQAYELVNRNLVELEQEVLALKEELVFYQGIVSPENAVIGVNVHSFRVKRKNNQKLLGYKLILTRQGKIGKNLKGDVMITFRGESGGEVKDLPLSGILPQKSAVETRFNFRYFQVFEGDLVFPDEFKPFEVEVAITSTSKKVKSFSKTIAWTEVRPEDI